MTDWHKSGLTGAAVALIFLGLFFFWTEMFLVVVVSLIVGYPIGLAVFTIRKRRK